MKILGISAFYHDSAAAIIEDGKIIAAAQEERFTRKKHDESFPLNAVKFCLKQANTTLEEIDAIYFYEKPLLKFERLMETYIAFAPKGFKSFTKAIPVWVKEKLFQKSLIAENLNKINQKKYDFTKKVFFSEHHLSHAASAYYPSMFNEAVVLTIDGVGEWATGSLSIGKGNNLEIVKEMHFPHSLGLLYSAFTYYTGFKVNSGEYKLMGLAPYGNPIYTDIIFDNLLDLKEDGSFRLNQEYFDYCTGLTMTNKKFDGLFGLKPRHPDEELTQKHMDIGASIQVVTEEIVTKMVKFARKEYGIENLCLAGGVALNCVANGKILKQNIFKNIWIQPAAGDAGGALGAALSGYYLKENKSRNLTSKSDTMHGSYLGPEFTEKEIEETFNRIGAKYTKLNDEQVIKQTAKALSDEKAIGWFQGRMEFGPRALGNRSIIADPRSPKMQKNLNLKVKFRESFRPFAPSVLAEKVSEWFDLDSDSPYMLIVADVASKHRIEMSEDQKALFGIEKLNVARSSIPAVTHVDYSARIQTVHKETNPRYHALISEFEKITGCSVLVNTSFNVRGEPIVCSPEDAYRCFMGSNLDVLVVGNYFLIKEEQPEELILDYKNLFELD